MAQRKYETSANESKSKAFDLTRGAISSSGLWRGEEKKSSNRRTVRCRFSSGRGAAQCSGCR